MSKSNIEKGLYSELKYLIDSYGFKEDDVEYVRVQKYPDPVEITLSELLELAKEVPDDAKAGDVYLFDIAFKNGYHIELQPDDEIEELELKIWKGSVRTGRIGHLDSLI